MFSVHIILRLSVVVEFSDMFLYFSNIAATMTVISVGMSIKMIERK